MCPLGILADHQDVTNQQEMIRPGLNINNIRNLTVQCPGHKSISQSLEFNVYTNRRLMRVPDLFV